MTINVGIIGCGYWGPNLIRNFNNSAGMCAAAVADLDPRRLEPLAGLYPTLRCTTKAEELLADDRIDAVAISTPVSTHHRLAKQALLAGKHVLIEKPLTDSVRDAEELVALARKQKRTLMVDHTFVYTPAVRKIKSIIESGALGEVYFFDSVRVNLGLFQHDVNVVWDLAPHDFSIMSYVLGKKPESVSAVGGCHVSVGDESLENIAYITIKLEENVLSHFHVNWLSPVKVRRILISGSKKMLIYDDLASEDQIKLYDCGVAITSGEDRDRALPEYRLGDMYSPRVESREALATLVEHFGECIRTGAPPITDGRAGLDVVKLLEAANESLRSGGSPVGI